MLRRFLASLVVLATLVATSHGDLTLTLNAFTQDEISISISGSFDTDVIGDQQQWLAIKSDYRNNVGVNVDWIDDSFGFSSLPGPWTLIENSITFNGGPPANTVGAASGQSWGDAFYFDAGFDITAGTTVAGTLHVEGTGAFDPANTAPLELASGFVNSSNSWARFEAVVPEPASGALGLLVLVGFASIHRRKR